VEHAKDWPKSIAKLVGQRIAYFREQARDERGRKLTVQALANRCAELGLPLGRPTIAKLENGLRETITVGELHVLAKALGVSPADLVLPLGQAAEVEVLPGQHMDTWDAVLWFSGFADRPSLPPEDYAGVVQLYQLHHVILQEFRGGRWAGPSAERMGVTALRAVRPAMRERGLLLPELPPGLAYVDNGDEQ
jgi:transcriptional regulator with XRE-family HTH domain